MHLSTNIGGSKGGTAGTCPPNRIQFFGFHMCFCQKVPVLEVGTPNSSAPPPQENPGSATDQYLVHTCYGTSVTLIHINLYQ